jgi:hypothetical protein
MLHDKFMSAFLILFFWAYGGLVGTDPSIAKMSKRQAGEYTDDDEPLFPQFASKDGPEKPLLPSKDEAEPSAKRVRRAKRIPPSEVDKAMAKIQGGGTSVFLANAPNEMGMDKKLSALIDYVRTHTHVISLELQATISYQHSYLSF